ncbi:MAG TPA: nucleotidyltransferase domain-containing protein [Dehalococcoidia bacterium]|nr:nucleotidyltransferase domain-containing protein [Dehalococcoidia bacterium]
MSKLPDIVEARRTEIEELCRRYGVERLYIFGSAARGELTAESDIDFQAEMLGREPTGGYADRVFGLWEDLETLFGRRIDLLTAKEFRNPYFRRQLEATRVLVYERPREEAAA